MKNTKIEKELAAFARNLIKFMALKNKTRSDLSSYLGYSDDRMIGRLINGKMMPTVEIFINICRCLEVDEMTMLKA